MLNWWGIGSAYKNSPAIGWTLLTFGIFVFFVIRFTKKPLALFLEERSDNIKNAIEEAKLAKLDAAAKLKQYEQRLLDLDAEILKMKSDFQHQGELERSRLKLDATKIAEQIQKESAESLKAEVSRALLDLKQEIAHRVLLAASKNINLTPELDRSLCSSFVRGTL
ncbi:MAG: ATP synthase F0 subunit B [Myxococcaceae bacterium]